MIYTVGETEIYLKSFVNVYPERPRKLGRSECYEGGSVWKTYEEAMNHCPKGYSVFGVNANWDNDTTPSNDGDWNNLLVDSELIILND